MSDTVVYSGCNDRPASAIAGDKWNQNRPDISLHVSLGVVLINIFSQKKNLKSGEKLTNFSNVIFLPTFPPCTKPKIQICKRLHFKGH
jgi:hypothetical protein